MTFYRLALAAVGVAISASAANAQTSDWANRITLNGDILIRLQHDLNTAETYGTSVDDRMRVRARLGINAKVNDSLMANFRLSTQASQASGFANMGEISTGETFGRKKGAFFDLAYADYKVMEGLNVQLGKVPNLFWIAGREEFVWNNATTFEGFQAKWFGDMGSIKPFVTANYHYAATRKEGSPTATATGAATGPDVTMFGAQAGLNWKTDPMWATLAVASYNWANIQDFEVAGSPTAIGNSTYTGGTPSAARFAADYKLLNVGAEFGYNLGFAPLAVYGEYVMNSGEVRSGLNNDLKNGMLGGFKLGALKEVGSWMVGYSYRQVQKDAFFAPNGHAGFLNSGTDVLGHEYQVGYQAWPNAAVSLLVDNGLKSISTQSRTYEIYLAQLIANF